MPVLASPPLSIWTYRFSTWTYRRARLQLGARCQTGGTMLILSRRPGESVNVGDEVAVTVLGVKGCQVRLGFTAPSTVAIHREEIYERMQAERLDKMNALKAAPPDGTTTTRAHDGIWQDYSPGVQIKIL